MPASIAKTAGGPSIPGNANEYTLGLNTTTNALSVVDSTGANKWEVAAKGGVQMTEVSIAAAAVATLRGTPVTLVAAPPTGYMNVFHQAVILLDYTAPAFTESTDNLLINYGTSTPVAASEIIEMTGFITLTADSLTFAVPDGGAATALGAATKFDALPLVLFNNGDGEFGNSGGSTLRVKTWYSVIPTGF